MATLRPEQPQAPHQFASHDLMFRVMREFDAMPALRVTLAQAMRLFSLDRAACEGVLDLLVEARLLGRDRSGRYGRHAD